eukprot:CAMPEP_0170611946 /NCGR_PEP_ID=MMETSP0224-20130122/23460_1 /TAXON_ID=285029 /ORGANISM="Togula jolla, Strain CCCM 725" /LENGTH=563 /DNA_ID=CAMNT_0010937415 /DNA_START=24 /DNA_END=1712 /DNA_ORIENTATION=-
MSMAMARARADAESRQSEEKKAVEKKRSLVVLCARFFQDQGYIHTVQQIQAETNISLDKIDAADNVDLPTILTEYEDFYEMRFGRKPKLIRKLVWEPETRRDTDRKVSLPRIASEQPPAQASPSSEDGGASGSRRRERSQGPRSKSVSAAARGPGGGRGSEDDVAVTRGRQRPPAAPSSAEPLPPPGQPTGALGPADQGAGIEAGLVGLSVAKAGAGAAGAAKKELKGDEVAGGDFYDNQLLKALPCYGGDKEYRDLAMVISRDILTRNPAVSWDSIVGLAPAKALLKEAVVMPLKYPQLFTGLLAPWKGILLFGPPGTGKTLLAKAVATECETTFFNISASSVVSKWRGDSEKLIRVLFDLARHHQPSTIFIDELDSLMSSRGGGDGEHEGSRRMKTELLIQMDGLLREVKDQVFLLAASNLPWDLDSAMLRRLEKRVLVHLPTAQAREAMIQTHLPEGFASGLEYGRLAELTEDWSGSDIRLLCKEAAMHPLRRLMAEIESAEGAAVPAHPGSGRGPRHRAADKAGAVAAGTPASTPAEELKMGPVTQDDVTQALQKVHRA